MVVQIAAVRDRIMVATGSDDETVRACLQPQVCSSEGKTVQNSLLCPAMVNIVAR